MARGFESKSVADQQEQAESRTHNRAPREIADPLLAARRRRLELSLADVQRKLADASAPQHLEMLRRAQAALEKDLADLG
jgi:hypothetical protein